MDDCCAEAHHMRASKNANTVAKEQILKEALPC
jgi:hypothetical protein